MSKELKVRVYSSLPSGTQHVKKHTPSVYRHFETSEKDKHVALENGVLEKSVRMG
tara:strand:- start:589 stop:753 length:165 start_codon:yes stop_codon:yes gene_type:complete